MSTHQDWEVARRRRDTAAVSIARAVIAHRSPTGADLAKFALAETDMARIEDELEPTKHTRQERK